jgi:hypothetical protein
VSPLLVQSVHAAPPVPHAMSCDPSAQIPMMQQPDGHEVASQVEGMFTQRPPDPFALATQVPPPTSGSHVSHCAPPLPQATPWVPSEHAPFPAQQPLQFEGPQLLSRFPHPPM